MNSYDTKQAQNVTLHDLETKFKLQLDDAQDFFLEWRQGRIAVDQLTEIELQQLEWI